MSGMLLKKRGKFGKRHEERSQASKLRVLYRLRGGTYLTEINLLKYYRRAPIYSGDMATLGGGCGC